MNNIEPPKSPISLTEESIHLICQSLLPIVNDAYRALPPKQPVAENIEPLPQRLSTEQAAEYLGLSRHTLNQWRLKERGPDFIQYEDENGVRRGPVRYDVADLDKYIEESKRKCGA